MSREDALLVSCLDSVDELVELQERLGQCMSDGFQSLGRERYANLGAFPALGPLVYDERERSSRWHVGYVEDANAPGRVRFDLVDLRAGTDARGGGTNDGLETSGIRRRKRDAGGDDGSSTSQHHSWRDDSGGLALRSANVRNAEASFRHALGLVTEILAKRHDVASACDAVEGGGDGTTSPGGGR